MLNEINPISTGLCHVITVYGLIQPMARLVGIGLIYLATASEILECIFFSLLLTLLGKFLTFPVNFFM